MGVHGVRHGAHKTDPQAHVGRDDRRAGCLAHGRADAHAGGTDAPAAETADKNGKGEKTGGKGEKPGTGETPAGPDDAQKNQKGDAPEKAEKSGSSVGRVLLLTLLPLLLIAAAVVVLLLVRKKKARQD